VVAAIAGSGSGAPWLAVGVGVRLGPIERVSYHLGEWGPTSRKISCGGGVVRLEGYRGQRPNTVDVLAPGQRLTLLVIAPEASAQTAHAVLMAAGHRGNTDNVDTLLRYRPLAADILGRADGQWEAALQRWEVDGGRMTVADEKVRHNGK
jgi:hypothetical protein